MIFQNEIETPLQIIIKMDDMKLGDFKQQINQDLYLGNFDLQEDQDFVVDAVTNLFLQLWSKRK